MTKNEMLTKAIHNFGNMPILKFIVINKISRKLKLIILKSQTTHTQTVNSHLTNLNYLKKFKENETDL